MKSKAVTTPQTDQFIARDKGQTPAFGAILTKSNMEIVVAYLKARK